MDSWTFNKIAGAVLGTCVVGMGIGLVAQGIYESGTPKTPGYALPQPKEASGGGGEKKPEVTPIAVRLEKADPKKGEADAKVCSACHNFQEGAGAKVGPDLWNVVERPKGKAEGFDYSAGMKAKGGNWTYADLDDFLTKPSAYVQGTKMGYPGQEDPEKRADIIAYLRTLSKDPKPLPKVTEADKKEAAGAEAKGGEAKGGGEAPGAAFVKMVAEADPKKGQSAGQVCTACHSVTKGGGTLVGPTLWDVFDRKKGSVAGFDYSKGLKDKGGEWTIDDLDKWLTKPSAYIPGTKMGYPGEANEKKRAEIIAWLHTLSDSPKPLPKAPEAGKKAATAEASGESKMADKGNGAGQAAGDSAFLKMVGEADPKKGQAAAQVCSACHNLKKGGGTLIGPDLWNVVDRKKGSVAGFDYSKGLKEKGGEWTFADLNAWLTKPSAYIPGTKMGYPGEANEKKRAEIIAFLRTLSDKPVPLPGAKEGEKKAEAPHEGSAKTMPPDAKPGDQKPPAPPAPPGKPQPAPKAPEPSAAPNAPKAPDEAKPDMPAPKPTHDEAGPATPPPPPPPKPEAAAPPPPPKPEGAAPPPPPADAAKPSASGEGPEPYAAPDPTVTPETSEPTLPKETSTPPSLTGGESGADKGEGGPATGPEPYSAPTPSDSK